MPVLIQALQDDHERVRRVADEALAKIGPEAKEAVPSLVQLLEDDDADVRRAAAETLEKIGPEAKEAIPTLIQLLLNENFHLRLNSTRELIRLDSISIPYLVELVKGNDVLGRRAAVFALGMIGQNIFNNNNMQVVPILIDALSDDDPDVRRYSALALGGIGYQGKDTTNAVTFLLDTLLDEDVNVQRSAAQALAEIGKLSVPGLIQLISTPNPVVCSLGIQALGMIRAQAKEAISTLIEFLSTDNLNRFFHEASKQKQEIKAVELWVQAPIIQDLVFSDSPDVYDLLGENLPEDFYLYPTEQILTGIAMYMLRRCLCFELKRKQPYLI